MLDPNSFPLEEHIWIQRKLKKIRHNETFQIFISETTSLKMAWESLLERSINPLGQKIDSLLIKYQNKQVTSDSILEIVENNGKGDKVLRDLPDK